MPFPKFHMRVTYRTRHVWGRPVGKSHMTAARQAFCKIDISGMRASPAPVAKVCSRCRRVAIKAGILVSETD